MNLLPFQMLLEMFSNCAFSAYFVLINHISARNSVHLQGGKSLLYVASKGKITGNRGSK